VAAPLMRDAGADERLIAWFRLGGASVLLAILLSNAGPGHAPPVRWLSAFYTAYALAMVGVSRSRSEWLARHVNAIHAVDFIWTTAASTIGGGTGSHGFIYFAFVLGAAAFRWGLRRTLENGALIVAVGTLQSAASAAGVTPWAFEFDVFLLRVSFIACGMAVLFGILADRLHRAREQSAAIATLVSRISGATTLREAGATALIAAVRLMHARGVAVVVKETYTGTVSIWHARQQAGDVVISDADVPRAELAEWVAPCAAPFDGCEFRRRDSREEPVCTAVTGSDQGPAPPLSLPPGVLTRMYWETLLVVPLTASTAWTGLLYVLDPAAHPRGTPRLRFLENIVRHATPGILNLYHLRRLRSRAESIERGRISRELHDTVNQSIAAIAMRLEVLRRHAAVPAPEVAKELAEIQPILARQSVELRHLVERLRDHDRERERLENAIADMVDRFGRQGDIDARLEWAAGSGELPPQRCEEVARIVQEALFNVRRHSGATRVLVRVEADALNWALSVEDNGCGLGFTGRLTGDELSRQRKAPRVIHDRAQALGGTLSIESSDCGTRLEIAFPANGGRR
jgi:signal transduction histidine kinase